MEELTDAELATLAARLAALADELDGQLESTGRGAQPVDLDEPIGRVSRMDAIQQQQMASAHRERHRVRRLQVQSALARVADGTYGECVLCDDPIGFGRLSARPETPVCVGCQEARERG